jgi:hypothetical protein
MSGISISRRGSIASAGAVSAPVTFGAVGAGAAGGGTSLSESHIISGTNRAILAFAQTWFASPTRPTIGVTCGGVAMTELGTITYYNAGSDYARKRCSVC